jgi:hypothetical protein
MIELTVRIVPDVTEYEDYVQIDQEIRSQMPGNIQSFYSEESLGYYLLAHSPEFPALRDYPLVFKYEYLVYPPFAQFGKGDVVLTDGRGRFLVLEIKCLHSGHGPTAQRKRTRQRQHAHEQARRYAGWLKASHPEAEVRYAIAINLRVQILGVARN